MQTPPEHLVRILRHHPAPAVSIDEAQELIAESSPESQPPDRDSVARLLARDPQLRLLTPPSRRWAGAGPRSWILIRNSPEVPEARSIEGRLRTSLRRIGDHLEPGSIRALARWERLLREERKVRSALRRRLRSRTPEAGSSARLSLE
ncbi:MAG: hypothetical protein EA351_11610 [Gemmatimonadales bacterium]|nr:MAG: hypothetical protein EA351_11610 [Gemmatimonadales bacterium]